MAYTSSLFDKKALDNLSAADVDDALASVDIKLDNSSEVGSAVSQHVDEFDQ